MNTEEALALIDSAGEYSSHNPHVYVATDYGRVCVTAWADGQFYIFAEDNREGYMTTNTLLIRGVALSVNANVRIDAQGQPYFEEYKIRDGHRYYENPVRISRVWPDDHRKVISDAQRKTVRKVLLEAASKAIEQEPDLVDLGTLYSQANEIKRMNQTYREKENELKVLGGAISRLAESHAKALVSFKKRGA